MAIRNVRAVAIAVLLLAVVGVFAAAGQAGLIFFVTDVDSGTFPQVNFNLRAIELGNQVVSGLNESSLTVYENGEQVSDLSVTQNEDGPITYIFVIDQGRASSYTSFGISNLRQVISTLVSGGYFEDDRDTVMVLGRQNITSDQTVVLLPATQTASELTTWVADFSFSRSSRNTRGLLGVSDAVQELRELVPVPGSQTTAIFFITRYIEDPSASVAPTSAQNVGADARQNFTSVHIFQTDFNRFRKDALEVLATASDGQYSGLTRTNFASAVSTVYQSVHSQRTYYSISYRSPVAEGEQREITINTPGRPGEGIVGSYQVSVLPASVNIGEPSAGSIIRREAIPPTEEGGLPTFSTSRVPVIATVSWPDGFPRNILSAELTANGNSEGSIDVSPDFTELEFEWDLSDISTEGLNSVTLEVTVVDELGISSSAESVVTVEVFIPPTPTPQGFELSPTTAALSLPVFCIIGVLIAGIGGGAIYFFRRRMAIPGVAPMQDEAEVSPTLIASDASGLALGTITVLEGPSGLINEEFKITTLKTRLGRDPSQTDISFYSDEESSVSRLHCTISLDDDNFFRLTDNGSSSGTRLNGRKIQPSTPVVLDHGDEIVLGNLAQRGVKLQFNFASEENVQGGYSGSADDRTHFMEDQELSDWDSPEN
jgi:hypothetical protein